MGLTAEHAASLLLRRRQARKSIAAYADLIEIPGVPIEDDDLIYDINYTRLAKHHKMVCDIQQSLIEGTLKFEGEIIRRAMVFMAPGGAKSTYGTVVGPTWAMGKFDGYNIISGSYGSELSEKQSRKSRQICESGRFRSLWGTTIKHDNKSVSDWSLTNDSSMRAVGILGGVTGNRADGIVIDDPIKGRADADSETVRNKTWDAIKDDISTRLKPYGWIMYILTRWHEDDPVGRLLPDNYDGETGFFRCSDGLIYYVLSIPAQCEAAGDPLGREVGEYFWPEWFPEDHWIPFKSERRTWNALYQQRPTSDEGDHFRADWFNRYDTLPDLLNIYITGDLAVTEGGGDFTEFSAWGIDVEDNIWLKDNWHGQESPDKWIDAFIDMCVKHRPLIAFLEGGVIRKSIEPFLIKRMEERQCYTRIEWMNPIHNKVINSRSFQGRSAMGKVYLPKGELGDRVLTQLVKFPHGKFDDFVDTGSMIGRALDDICMAFAPEENQDKSVDRWEKAFDDDSDGDWKTV